MSFLWDLQQLCGIVYQNKFKPERKKINKMSCSDPQQRATKTSPRDGLNALLMVCTLIFVTAIDICLFIVFSSYKKLFCCFNN